MKEKVSRRDFLKLVGVGATTLTALLLPRSVKRTYAKAESELIGKPKTIAEMCPFYPELIPTLTAPHLTIDQTTVAQFRENAPTSERTPGTLHFNHGAYRPDDGEANILTIFHADEKRFRILIPNKPAKQVEVSENVGAKQDNFPIRVTTTIPEDNNGFALIGVTYEKENLNPYLTQENRENLQAAKGVEEFTEVFSATDIARNLLKNSMAELGLSCDDVEQSQIDQTMIIGGQCVLMRVDVAGRKALVAFDVISRKPIDLFSTSELNNTQDGFNGLAATESDIKETHVFTKVPGLIITKAGNPEIVIDLDKGIISTPRFNNGNLPNEVTFIPAFVGEYTHHYLPPNLNPEQGPEEVPPFLLFMPILDRQKNGVDHEVDQSLDDWTRPVQIFAGSETTYQLDDYPSKKPPKITIRLPISVSLKRFGTYKGRAKPMTAYDVKATRLQPLEGDSSLQEIGRFEVLMPVNDNPASVFEGHMPKYRVVKGQLQMIHPNGKIDDISPIVHPTIVDVASRKDGDRYSQQSLLEHILKSKPGSRNS